MVRIAFTSSDGTRVDRHFGQVTEFHVWEVGPDVACFVGKAAVRTGRDEEDASNARAGALEGCAIVCTMAIGGPAAAKVVGRRVHPMKTEPEAPVAEVIERLQQVLRGTPPPWLRKVLGPAAAAAELDCSGHPK